MLARRVAELEKKERNDEKKFEQMRSKVEQSNQEREHFKRQLDTVKHKMKNQEL